MLLTAKIAVKLFSKLHVLIYLAPFADTYAELAALLYMCAILSFYLLERPVQRSQLKDQPLNVQTEQTVRRSSITCN